MLGQSFALGGNLADIGITTAPGAEHVNESAHGSLTLPRPQRNRGEIFDGQTGMNRDLFGLLP